MTLEIITGDCRTALAYRGPFDLIVADPPYGDTKLSWDRHVRGWEPVARSLIKPAGSMWVFGSLKFFMVMGPVLAAAGWRYAQEIVWEKHNGSGFANDRFKRVHELVAQFYRDDVPWESVYNEVQMDQGAARARTVRRRQQPIHLGEIAPVPYVTAAGDPLIMRSVIYERSCHGSAIHPTQKPTGLMEIIIRTSCPPGGLVGDFFAGSGSAGVAAAALGREYVGAEKKPEIAERARRRLEGVLPFARAAE